jgi:hypothetical protein
LVHDNPTLAFDAVGPSTPTIEYVNDIGPCRPADKFRQCGLAITDHRDRRVAGPALVNERGPHLRQRTRGAQRRQGKPSRPPPRRLHLSNGDVEVAGLMARRGADMRPVDQHNDARAGVVFPGLRTVRRRGGVYLFVFQRISDAMEAIANTDVVWRGAGQESRQEPGRFAEGVPRSEFCLKTAQLRRAAVRQQVRKR